MGLGTILHEIGSQSLMNAAINTPTRFVARKIRADEEERNERRKANEQKKQAGSGSLVLTGLKRLGGGGRAALRAATVMTGAGLLEQGVGNMIEDVYDNNTKKKPSAEKKKQAGFLGEAVGSLSTDILGQAIANGALNVASSKLPGMFGTKEERDAVRESRQKKQQEKQMTNRTKQAASFYATADGISFHNPNPLMAEQMNFITDALKRNKQRYAKSADVHNVPAWKVAVDRAINAQTIENRERYIKLAAAGMGDATDLDLETAVGQLSTLYLKDKAPRLFNGNYHVGFRILDKSDDNTQAVGVSGFNIGNEWIYIPTFFLNGKLKGHELMYLYNKDQFRPLKENWINTIIRKKSTNVGYSDIADIGTLGVRYPDMRQLTQPSVLGKLAKVVPPAKVEKPEDAAALLNAQQKLKEVLAATKADSLQKELKKAAEIVPAILDMPQWIQQSIIGFSKTAALDYSDNYFKKTDNICDLEKICGTDLRVFTKLAYACDLYPTLKQGLDQFYGTDFFQRTYNRLDASMQKTADARSRRGLKYAYEDDGTLGKILTKDTKIKHHDKKRNVSVLIDVGKNDLAKNMLNETQVARIIDGLPAVIDHRNHDEIAVLHDGLHFRSPDKTGVYNVFMANGQVRECLVILDPIGEQPNLERCLVIDWKRKECIRAKARSVLCISEPFNEDWFDRLPANAFRPESSMPKNNAEDSEPRSPDKYMNRNFQHRIFVGKDGRGTIPITARTVNEVTNNGIWRIEQMGSRPPVDHSGDAAYNPYMHIVTERMMHTVMNRDYDRQDQITKYGKLPNLIIARKEVGGNTFIIREDKLYLPKVFKYIDLSWSLGDSAVALASENDIRDLLFKFRRKLKGHKTASDKYVLNSSTPLSYNKAFERLVLDFDFREKTAEEILSTFDLVYGQSVEIPYLLPMTKLADMYSNTPEPPKNLTDGSPNVLSPTFLTPPTGTEPYVGVATQMPYQDVQQLGYEGQQMPPLAQTPDVIPPPDPLAMQDAQNAAKNHQKDVFDVSTLAGLLKNDRNDDLIRDYAKIFKQALDRFGRLLFKFYWDKDFFAERFGEDKLQALEDSLKDSLDKVGDLCLFIEEKDDRPAITDILGSAAIEEAPEESV
jgi:hypothetical protein